MNLDRNKLVTALTLLEAFDAYCPDSALKRKWNEDELQNALVALCRLRQLKAMLAAFDIPFEPDEFIGGLFVTRQRNRYTAMLERLCSAMRPDFAKWASPGSLDVVFRTLRSYRLGMARGRQSTGIFLSYSGILAHVMEDVISPINEQVKRVMEPIDSLVAELIAPDGRTFTIGELIDRYGYPDDHADELEWNETWGSLFDDDSDEEAPE